MNGKVWQLSPQAGTRVTARSIAVQDSWSGPSASTLDMGFLRSWFESDTDFDDSHRGTNWGAISGLALSVAISASFWAGVVWIGTRVWR